jgi:hydrogenase maturation protease
VILIIAYGNSLRRDDGAGFFLAAQLEELLKRQGLEVECIAVHQLTPELAMEVAADSVQAVIFVDTRVADPNAENLGLEVRSVQDLPASTSLGHQLSPAVVLTYANLLYDRHPPAWLLTIPGVDFAHGEGFSEAAERALATLPDLLAKLPPDWPLTKDFP